MSRRLLLRPRGRNQRENRPPHAPLRGPRLYDHHRRLHGYGGHFRGMRPFIWFDSCDYYNTGVNVEFLLSSNFSFWRNWSAVVLAENSSTFSLISQINHLRQATNTIAVNANDFLLNDCSPAEERTYLAELLENQTAVKDLFVTYVSATLTPPPPP